MRRLKNHGVVYNGLVGQNTKPKKYRASTACKKVPRICFGGPMDGETLWLNTPTTYYFTLHGQTGRYVNGRWESA